MKKIFGVICLFSFLYGCQEAPDLADVDTLTPAEEFKEVGADTKPITDEMELAIDTIVSESLDFINYYKAIDWTGSNDKDEQSKYIAETIDKIKSVHIPQKTQTDREIYEVLFKYQYNAIKCLRFLQAYVETGDFSNIRMLDRKLHDLQQSNAELLILAEIYDF